MNQRRLSSKDTDLIDRIAKEWRQSFPDHDTDLITLADRIIVAGRRLEQSAANAAEHFCLDYTAMDVLLTLIRRGRPYSITPPELPDEMMVTSGALTTCLGRLTKRGRIKPGRHPHDAQLKTVILTDNGLEVAREAYSARVDAPAHELSEPSLQEKH
ncbi:MAG: hypothetical protein AAFX09_13710 [Pseudomonadota bacterium]